MLNEAMVRQIIGTEGAEALIECTRQAWQDFLDEGRARFHRTTRAAVVWDHMVLRCDAMLPEMDGVARIERHERPLYVLRDALMIRPKMHSRESTTRNYPTEAQVGLGQDGLFDGIPYPNVAFGYRLDAAEAGIEQYLATSPSDSWIIDLSELAAGELRPATGMFEMPDLDVGWTHIPSIRFRRSSE